MADGSPEDRTGPYRANDLTFSAPIKPLCDTNECSDKTIEGDSVKLSFYRELDANESCEKSETRGVAAAGAIADSRKHSYSDAADVEGRKRRCIDRYDSSESSDSGVALLSSTESSACSGSSDITSPRSPRSPESSCSAGAGEEGSPGARMPPWANDPAPPPAARRIPAAPAPVRRSSQLHHRRITEYFNHKMKPQNGLKRDHAHNANHDDAKKKCLPKNGVTHDLEKYISYISQTLSPKVLMDVGRQADVGARKPTSSIPNGSLHNISPTDLSKTSQLTNGVLDLGRSKDGKEMVHTTMNGFMQVRQGIDNYSKEKPVNGHLNGFVDGRKQGMEPKILDPSANGINRHITGAPKGKVPIPALPSANVHRSPIKLAAKPDTTRMNGVVSSTTKLDSRMNGVMCGSNNLSLKSNSHKLAPLKREMPKKSTDGQPSKRTNRKSSACIANSKNLTWSKANNLKQVQLQKQNCVNNVSQNASVNNMNGEANSAPKMNMTNGVRHVSMTVNGSIGNLNVPANNYQNCHQINIPQPCNGTVTSNNLTSFVAVPQNVMLTTLRIPQNGIPAQTLNHQNNINNMTSFNRTNVNVSSPTKLNGQFVFPLMQNINGTVVQIPNLMAKMPNFVLPQNHQMPQRQDHQLQNQQAQILFNGTLLKLANTLPAPYQNVNKSTTMTSQSLPTMNKNSTVGMTVQPKPNFNFVSHPVLMPQTGFLVTSVPNMTVKETWSYTGSTATSARSSCSNPIVNHPPPLLSFTNQTLHTSSIPIAPVKPPDNPIQGTEPPSSTVKEPETNEAIPPKCDIPWLSKTVNNNIVQLETSKISTRPFAHVSSTLSDKLEDLATVEKIIHEKTCDDEQMKVEEDNKRVESTSEQLRKVEEVARREETIFTQITVLKDVTSNVHSTMIEANFRGDSTESESGIGTDKSIDSPSDSQTSKECDDDSSLSLSISISSVETQCQKSPILKQPKTLRFPPKNLTKKENEVRRKSSHGRTSTVVVCQWEKCKKEFEGDPDLLEHLQSEHVETQVGRENYVCLWEQCKVRGKPSCSRLWLERHTLSHGGSKPFRCIVDGCERRFSNQTLLERHVNNHFNETSPNTGSGKKTADSAARLIRRNGKKLRYRRQPWSARMFDFFDPGMMEGLAWRLFRATRWRLGGGCPLREPPGTVHTITLHAALSASRYNGLTDTREHLLSYYPPHVIEDEWVAEKDVKLIKRVEIASLPAHVKVSLYDQFCESYTLEPSPLPQKSQSRLPAKNCKSSRVLNNLIAKQRKSVELKPECSADYLPLYLQEKVDKVEVSGAKKRKMGRPYGGNSFWPCGR